MGCQLLSGSISRGQRKAMSPELKSLMSLLSRLSCLCLPYTGVEHAMQEGTGSSLLVSVFLFADNQNTCKKDVAHGPLTNIL